VKIDIYHEEDEVQV